jgi:hypothetical protein
MQIRTIAAGFALAASALLATSVGHTLGYLPPPPVAQTNPWPDAKPDYIAVCRRALMTAEANVDRTSAASLDLVRQLISHAQDSQAKGDTFACYNEANQAIDLEK